MKFWPLPLIFLAGALNSSEPIKKPQTHCTRDVKNHLADSDLYVTIRLLYSAIRYCRSHCVSFSASRTNTFRISSVIFLTDTSLYVIPNSLPHTQTQGKLNEKEIKSVRHYSFGRYGCQYTSGRVSDTL